MKSLSMLIFPTLVIMTLCRQCEQGFTEFERPCCCSQLSVFEKMSSRLKRPSHFLLLEMNLLTQASPIAYCSGTSAWPGYSMVACNSRHSKTSCAKTLHCVRREHTQLLRGRHNGETTKSLETTGAGFPRHMKNKMAAV